MTASLRRLLPLVAAIAGLGLLGSSVQGVAAMDDQLRASVRALPVDEERHCPYDAPARSRRV